MVGPGRGGPGGRAGWAALRGGRGWGGGGRGHTGAAGRFSRGRGAYLHDSTLASLPYSESDCPAAAGTGGPLRGDNLLEIMLTPGLLKNT